MARTPFSGDVSVDLLSDDGDADEHAFFTPAPLGRGGTLGAAAAFDARSRSPTPRAANTKQLPARHSGGAKASPAKPRVSLGGHDDLGRSRESLGGRGARATDVSPAVSQAPSSTQAGPGFGLKQTEKLIDDLKKENFSLKLKIFYLEEKLEKASPGGLHEAIKENAEHKATIHQLTLDRDALLTDLDAATSAVMRVQDERAAAFEDSERFRNEADHLHNELESLREEVSQASRSIERMARDRDDVASRLNAAVADKEEAERRAEAAEEEAAELRSKLMEAEDAEERISASETKAREAEAENARLLNELESRNAEIEGLRDRLAAVESAGVASSADGARVAELESLLESYRDEKERLKGQYELRIQSVLADMEEAEEREAAVRAQLEETQQRADTEAREAAQLRSHLEEVEEQLGGVSVAELQGEIATAEAEADQLRDRVAELQEEVERLENELESFRGARRPSYVDDRDRAEMAEERADALERQHAEDEARIAQLEEECDVRDKKIEELEHQLQSSTASSAPSATTPRHAAATPRHVQEFASPVSKKSSPSKSLAATPAEKQRTEAEALADELFEQDVAALQDMINNLQERFGPEEEAFDSRRSSFALDPEQKAMHDLRNVLYGAVRAALKFAKELKDEKTVNRRMRMLYEKDDSLWRMEMEDREAWVADWKTKYEELLAASDAKEIAMQEELQTLLVQVSEMKQTMLRADAEQASQAKRMLDEMQSYRLRVQAAESQLRTLEQENTALKDQIDDMDNGTSALKNELLESNRRSEEAERRFHETVTAAERERKQLAARNQQLQDEIASLQHSLSNLRQQQEHRVQQYQEDVEGLAQQREQARLEALRLRTEAESLQQQILDLSHRHSRETSSISKENERLTAELAQTTGTIKDLRAAIASYETRVTTLVAANDNTARDLHQQAEKIEELEMAISRLQNLCDAQNQDIQSWEESANQLQTQLKSERQRQQAYASQVEDLKDQADKQHILLERVDTRIAGLLEMTGLDEVRGDDMLSRLGAVEGWVGEVQRGMVDAIHACRRKIRSIESNLQSQAGNLEDLENIARRANTKHQQLSELYNQTNFDLERTQNHVSSFNEQLKNLQGEIDSLLQARSSSLAQIRTLDQKVKAAEARAEAAERTLGGVQGATAHVRELQHQLQLSEDKNETLSTQLQEAEERLRLERQGAKTRVQELLEASKKQQKLNDVLEERSQQLTRKLHELEREHMELAARFKASIGAESEATTRQLLEAREQLTEMRSQLESERETWKRLDKELDDLRAKYRRLKTQYDRREGLVKSALESLMAIQEKKDLGALSVVTQYAAQAEKLLLQAATR